MVLCVVTLVSRVIKLASRVVNLVSRGISCRNDGMTEMPNTTTTDLRMYCNSFPIVINKNRSFSNFEETLPHFDHV